MLSDALANPDFGIHAVGRENHAAPDVLADVVLEPPAGRQNVVHARVELADLVVEGDQSVLGVPKHEPLGEALDRVLEPVLGAFPFGDVDVNGDHAAAGQGMTACLDDPAIGEDTFQAGLGAALRRAGAARDEGDEFLQAGRVRGAVRACQPVERDAGAEDAGRDFEEFGEGIVEQDQAQIGIENANALTRAIEGFEEDGRNRIPVRIVDGSRGGAGNIGHRVPRCRRSSLDLVRFSVRFRFSAHCQCIAVTKRPSRQHPSMNRKFSPNEVN